MDHAAACDATEAWGSARPATTTARPRADLRHGPLRATRAVSPAVGRGPEVFADLSKNLSTGHAEHLLDLARRECRPEERRDAMFAGEPINSTEGRAVLHTGAARAARPARPLQRRGARRADAMLAYAESGARPAASGIRHVVNIGIGGSDLGPQMAVPALDAFATRACSSHFVANVDGHDIRAGAAASEAGQTLFIVASKTFTTQETMANARWRAWVPARTAGRHRAHFVATTTNVPPRRFGISTTFGFWDWVGGRYFAVVRHRPAAGHRHRRRELPRACWPARTRWTAISPKRRWRRQPAGAAGLLDVWYRNFHGFTSRSVAPYHQGLAPAGLPAAARDGEQRQARRPGGRVAALRRHQPGGGASPAPTASMPTSRCCTRART